MSGPQGSDPTQPWPGQQPEPPRTSRRATRRQPAWQPPTPGRAAADHRRAAVAAAGLHPPQQYPQYQQPRPAALPAAAAVSADRAVRPAAAPSTARRRIRVSTANPASGQYGQQYGQQPGQYGQQPGQYGQQPGQYGQYPQYGRAGRRGGLEASLAVIGGVIGLLAAIIVAVVLVLGFWKPGFFVTTKLDVNAAQTGVQQILTDEANGYGAKNVKDVKCNDGQSPTVKKGDDLQLRGQHRRHQAPGDGDVPGRQRHLRGGSAQVASLALGQSRRAPSAAGRSTT